MNGLGHIEAVFVCRLFRVSQSCLVLRAVLPTQQKLLIKDAIKEEVNTLDFLEIGTVFGMLIMVQKVQFCFCFGS